MRGPQAAALLMVGALLAVGIVAIPDAQAQSSFDHDRVEFGGVDGEVSAIRAVGDQLWVGGEFGQAVDADLTTQHDRTNLAVFDFNTGQVRPLTADTNGKVTAIDSDDASRVWVAGSFTEIAGESVTYLAAFNAFSGKLDPDFDVVLDDEVDSIHYRDGWLYIGGIFDQVNGLDYQRLARVDAATGELDTNFRANPDGRVTAIDTFDSNVYAVGYFGSVGFYPDNDPRRWVASFSADTGQPAGPDFVVPPLGVNESAGKMGMRAVRVSQDGAYLYTGDNRNVLTQWNRVTGERNWDVETEGDIQSIGVDGPTVYGGVHDGFLAKLDGRLLFALDVADGSADDGFVPLLNSFDGVAAISAAQGALIAGGGFTTVNGESSPHLALFHGPEWSGALPLTTPAGDVSCDGTVDIVDALFIAQFSVGLRTVEAGCPLLDPRTEMNTGGDVNDDGSVDIVDALLVAQCSVGLTNLACPA